MALNKFMHPRNIYKKAPDFKHMAIKSADFRKHIIQDLSGKVSIDFKNAAALRCLTITLLKEDFGLDVELPLNRLIPTLTLRLNYIHWLEDILHPAGRDRVTGIDIGTGASCVYPLLGCKLNNWQFLATDVDSENIVYARKNVTRNGLEEMITVKHVPPDTILHGILGDSDSYDFCMCNPPFFADHMEAQGLISRTVDRPEPSSSSTASGVEQIAEGGEKEFVKKMIAQSLELKDRVRVFTSMLGKKASVAPLKSELKRLEVPQFSSTEFCQGKTMRWGLAWTFDDTVQFPKSSFQAKKKEKPPLTYVVPRNSVQGEYSLDTVGNYIRTQLNCLKMKFEEIKYTEKVLSLSLCATENTWSHQRRKRRQRERGKVQEQTDINDDSGDHAGSDCSNVHKDIDSPKTEIQAHPLVSNSSSHTRGDNPIKGDKPTNTDEACSTGEPNSAKNSCMHTHNENLHRGCEKLVKRTADDQLLLEECKRNKLDDDKVEPVSFNECTVTGNSSAVEDTSIEQGSRGLGANKSTACGQSHKQSPGNCGDQCLLKCSLTLQICEEEIQMEMTWIDGQNRELMHQVMQYFKNKLNPTNS